MKASHILYAMLACAALTPQARATATADGRPSAAASQGGEAAGRAAPNRDARAGVGRASGREPNHAAAPTGGSDRVRALLNRQAPRSRAAAAANRHASAPTVVMNRRGAAQTTVAGGVAPRPGASSDTGPVAANLSQSFTNRSQGPAAAMPNRTPPRALNALPPSSTARTGTLGGRRAEVNARLGGPASGKAAHAAALGGTQLLRRK
jgi:hypothetical protein